MISLKKPMIVADFIYSFVLSLPYYLCIRDLGLPPDTANYFMGAKNLLKEGYFAVNYPPLSYLIVLVVDLIIKSTLLEVKPLLIFIIFLAVFSFLSALRKITKNNIFTYVGTFFFAYSQPFFVLIAIGNFARLLFIAFNFLLIANLLKLEETVRLKNYDILLWGILLFCLYGSHPLGFLISLSSLGITVFSTILFSKGNRHKALTLIKIHLYSIPLLSFLVAPYLNLYLETGKASPFSSKEIGIIENLNKLRFVFYIENRTFYIAALIIAILATVGAIILCLGRWKIVFTYLMGFYIMSVLLYLFLYVTRPAAVIHLLSPLNYLLAFFALSTISGFIIRIAKRYILKKKNYHLWYRCIKAVVLLMTLIILALASLYYYHRMMIETDSSFRRQAEQYYWFGDEQVKVANYVNSLIQPYEDLIVGVVGSRWYKVFIDTYVVRAVEPCWWLSRSYGYQYQRDEGLLLQMLLSGIYVIENGIIRISENNQYNPQMNPLVAISTGEYYNLFYFNDSDSFVTLKTNKDVVNYPLSIATYLQEFSGNASKTHYILPQINISRIISVSNDSGDFTMKYDLLTTKENTTIITMLNLSLCSVKESTIKLLKIEESANGTLNMTLQIKLNFFDYPLNAGLILSPGKGTSVEFYGDSKKFSIVVLSNRSNLQFTMFWHFPILFKMSEGIRYYTARDILHLMIFKYIIIDLTAKYIVLIRESYFLQLSLNSFFTEIYSTKTVHVFKVNEINTKI